MTEDISTDEIWISSRNPWTIENDIRILDGASLTLDAGVKVEFNGRYSITCYGSGRVLVNGLADNMVFITSATPSSFNYGSLGTGIGGVVKNCTLSYGDTCLLVGTDSRVVDCYVSHSLEGIRFNGYNLEIRGCVVSECDVGIHSVGGLKNLIIGCNVTQCVKGIQFEGSTSDTTIESCDVSGCSIRGIEVLGNDNRVLNCSVSSSKCGVMVSGSQGVLVQGVVAIECQTGIDVGGASESSPIRIEHCAVRKCQRGINFNRGQWIIVTNSTVESNDIGVDRYPYPVEYPGVFLWRNNFLWNKVQVEQSIVDRNWSRNGTGNYWTDYEGTDHDGDGIGDVPYDVTPTRQDPFPLMEPVDFEPPSADAGPDITVRQHRTFKLDGSGSLDDTWIANWTWIVDMPGGNLTLYGAVVEGAVHVAGVYDVVLLVTDAVGKTGSDVLRLEVTDGDPPEFVSIDVPDKVFVGDAVNLSCMVRDNVAVVGVSGQYTYGNGPIIHCNLSDGGGGLWSIEVPVPIDLGAPVYYILTARDSARNTNSTGYLSIEVVDNVPPELVPDLPDFATTGEGAFCCCTVVDNIGVRSVVLEYGFPGLEAVRVNLTGFGSSWSALVQVPPDAGSPMTVRFTAVDLSGNTATAGPLELDIRDDDLPTLGGMTTSPPADAWHRNDTVSIEAVLADNRGIATADLEVMYPATGWTTLTMEPTAGVWSASFVIATDLGVRLWYRLNVSDAAGNRLVTPEVEVGLLSQHPRILTAPVVEVYDGHSYVLELLAEDPDSVVTGLQWHLATNATWLHLDGGNATLSGTPAAGDIGVYTVNVSVTDGEGGVAWLRFDVEVRDFNWPPAVTIIAPDDGFRASGWLTVTARVTDDDGIITWVRVRVDDGEWVDVEGTTLWSLNLETGEMDPGPHTISVKAFDGVSESDVRSVNFTVPGSDGKQLPGVVVIGPVLALVIAIPVAVYLLRRRRANID